MKGEIEKILALMPSVRVAVVGDIMLDRYLWGRATRISPEAPVPVVALERVSDRPGGAGNVAANIAGLGAEAKLVGLVGNDDEGRSLKKALEAHGISDKYLVEAGERSTTTKTRVMVHHQQIARVDNENTAPADAETESAVIERLNEVIPESDCVVISDYAKGCITQNIVAAVTEIARKHARPVIVDPKSRQLTRYNGATILTPNLAEALTAAGIVGGEEHADEAAKILLSNVDVESILITLGEHGMKLFRRGQAPVHFPSTARQVFDVTGAGDTVVALLAAALGARADINAAIELANIGAGIAVEKVGTTVIKTEELRVAIEGQISQAHEAAK